MPRVGVLDPAGSAPFSLRMKPFRHGLSEAGYVEGSSVAIESRHVDGKRDRLAKLAADLIERGVNVRYEWRPGNPCGSAGDDDDSNRGVHGRSCRSRPRRQPCSAWGILPGISILSPELDVKRVGILKEVVADVCR